MFGQAKKIVYINDPLYYYVYREKSIMNSSYSIKRLDGLEARFERLKYIEKNYSEYLEIEKKSFLFLCLYHYQCALKTKNRFIIKSSKSIINKFLNNINLSKVEITNFKMKDKLWIYLCQISLDLTCIIRNKLKIGV